MIDRTKFSVVLLVLCAIGFVSSWTFVMVDDEVMTVTTDVIIEGTVVAFAPSLYSNMPATAYKVSVTEVLKSDGDITEHTSTVNVIVPGGLDPKNDSIRLYLEGAPSFEVGENVLLFLIKHKGEYQVQHWALGAFHQLTDSEGTTFATRLADEEQPQKRHFGQFKSWIRTVLSGKRQVEKTYYATPVGKVKSPRYHLFTYGNFNVRWFVFDSGQTVTWAVNGVQAGITDGGNDQIDEAMGGWNNDPSTAISYVRQGTTTNTDGLSTYDTINSIVWNDPTDYIAGSYDCSSGGTLAVGGWWSNGQTGSFRSITFSTIVSGDVVVQDGIECWFTGQTDPSDTLNACLAHELGHTLGLDHSCGDSNSGTCVTGSDQDNAVMRAYIENNRGPVPGIDDVNAIVYLYSPSGTIVSSSTSATTAAATTAAATTAAATVSSTSATATTGSTSTTGTTSQPENTYSDTGASETNTNTNTNTGSGSTTSDTSAGASTTGSAAPGTLYFGSTIYNIILTVAGDPSSVDKTTFANQVGSIIPLDPNRVYIATIGTGRNGAGTADVSFYLYEEAGEISSHDATYALYDKLVDGDPSVAASGLVVYYITAYFVPNSYGSKPASPTSTPTLEAQAGTAPTATKTAKGVNYAIVGGAVGGGVALIAIVAVVAFVVIKKRGSGSTVESFGYPSPSPNQQNDIGMSNMPVAPQPSSYMVSAPRPGQY